ncbi:alpha-D-kanosaminyltransferase [bacterium BMS3Abin10]|nr:alpha-D-kanosaminyltransferase [bacterium BMS3Abin10]
MKLSLFFTFGVSAGQWKEKGLLDREKLIYEKLLESGAVDKIYWFTYGIADKEIEKELINGIEIIPMPSIYRLRIGKLFYSFLMPFVQRKYIKQTDILKTNQINGSWTAVLASKLYGKPLVVRTGWTWSRFRLKSNNPVLYRLASLIERMAYRNADAVVVTTQDDADYISNRYRKSADKLMIVPNYVDTDMFSVTDKHKYDDKFVFVGRLTEQKNLKNLIQALQGLPYGLDIYGDGEMKDELGQLAGSLKVRVDLKGNVPNSELPEILNQYPLFVLPSFYEGMPKALLEAMSCGCAVIGTDVDGIRGLIRDGVNGILCNTTHESIRSAIEKVMKDNELMERLGKQARSFVVENYSLENVIADEINVHKKVCNVR